MTFGDIYNVVLLNLKYLGVPGIETDQSLNCGQEEAGLITVSGIAVPTDRTIRKRQRPRTLHGNISRLGVTPAAFQPNSHLGVWIVAPAITTH
jgi:hypothetical protein